MFIFNPKDEILFIEDTLVYGISHSISYDDSFIIPANSRFRITTMHIGKDKEYIAMKPLPGPFINDRIRRKREINIIKYETSILEFNERINILNELKTEIVIFYRKFNENLSIKTIKTRITKGLGAMSNAENTYSTIQNNLRDTVAKNLNIGHYAQGYICTIGPKANLYIEIQCTQSYITNIHAGYDDSVYARTIKRGLRYIKPSKLSDAKLRVYRNKHIVYDDQPEPIIIKERIRRVSI